MVMKFKDDANKYILAMDFDGTITQDNIFPDISEPRKYAKEVINLLYDLGVAVIIWTCRDKSDTPDRHYRIYDDQVRMVRWLGEQGIKYTDINTCIRYAPYMYESRKIYAHMYVDDRGFGWNENDDVMIDVLMAFMEDVMHINPHIVIEIANQIRHGVEVNIDALKAHIH